MRVPITFVYFPGFMAVRVRYLTDPACSWSWSTEPTVRRLMWEFGDNLRWTYIMGGLARDFRSGFEDPAAGIGGAHGVYPGLVSHWLDVAATGRMPCDPRLWVEAPIASTYPACMAVKAAAAIAPDAGYAYLRALREGLLCSRRKLDTPDSLVEVARSVGLDAGRFRMELDSHATVEAFGADLEEARTVPDDAREQGQWQTTGGPERVPFPTIIFSATDGTRHPVYGFQPYSAYRQAAEAAGAVELRAERPGIEEALRHFGRMATREVEVLCDLPGPRARAELWRLATEWRVKPVEVLIGELWELAA
jgi:putative protein-disulfide isomerase